MLLELIVMDIKTTLEDLCLNIKNEQSSFRPSPVVTNRAQFIMNKITEMQLTYKLDAFLSSPFYRQPVISDERGEYKYYNIIVKFPASNPEIEEGVMFTAHHDVNNIESNNCQDNTASVVNLLRLCFYLKDKNDLKRNVYIVFTDSEEFGGKGALRVSEQIINNEFGKLQYVVNSELTALGEYIWSEKTPDFSPLKRKLEESLEKMNEKFCPFNDSFVFRGMGIDSICLGTLPKDENGRLKTEHWRICHSNDDKIEQANYDHMEQYVQFLLKLI